MSSSHFYLHFFIFQKRFQDQLLQSSWNFFLSFPFFFSSFSSLRAAVCPLSSSGWSPSGDLGHAEILIDGETSLQTLLEMLPVISHHWHQHALEVYFFRACKQWNGDFIRFCFCLISCSGLMLAKQSNYLLGTQWNGYLRHFCIYLFLEDTVVQAWRLLCLTPSPNLLPNARQVWIWGQTSLGYTV